jgi:hypothetical protein
MASQCTDVLTRALEAFPYWLVFRVLIEKFPHQEALMEGQIYTLLGNEVGGEEWLHEVVFSIWDQEQGMLNPISPHVVAMPTNNSSSFFFGK